MDGGEVRVAGVGRRRADGHEQQPGVLERVGDVGREVQAIAVALDELGEARLPDRDPALLEALDLGLVDVDAPDVVAQLGEAGGGDQADVAGPDDPDGLSVRELAHARPIRVSSPGASALLLRRVSDSATASICRELSDCESVLETQ